MAGIAVVGGANVDIGGFSSLPLTPGDSNPGRVHISLGGVGHNIAANIARLGMSVELVTALGSDGFTHMITQDCAACGIGLSHAVRMADTPSSVYLFIADDTGDMSVAVNDMGLHERMTPELLEDRLPSLNAMDLVVLDANLPAETLSHLARRITVPLIADAVSAAKAERLRGAFPYLSAFKPNRIEAERLTGIAVRDAQSARLAALALCGMGIERVYLTLGTEGVCCAEGDRAELIPGRALPMVNATGAGDAFTAALAWAHIRGMDLHSSALAGMAAASLALQAVETVDPAMSEERLLCRMRELAEE